MTFCSFLPNFPDELSVQSQSYSDYLFQLKDLYLGFDLNDQYLFLGNQLVEAEVIIKSPHTILSGLSEVEHLFSDVFKFNFFAKDGDEVGMQQIFRISGSLSDILNYERFILDLLRQMSSVSTETKDYVDLLKNSKILPAATRKSLLSPILKKAVSIGGGVTHRLNLGQALIVKDNFKVLSLSELYRNLLTINLSGYKFVEFEIESLDELNELLLLTSSPLPARIGIMLDNFTPEMLKQALNYLSKSDLDIFLEISGGISRQNILDYALPGVDIISMSSLFAPASYSDFSLELLRK